MSMVAASDWVIDIGPGAGAKGGQIVASGPPREVAQGPGRTAPYLAEGAIEMLDGIAPEHVLTTLRHDRAVILAELGHAEDAVTGLVAAPALGRRWWAAKGTGDFAGRSLTSARRLSVSGVSHVSDASISIG